MYKILVILAALHFSPFASASVTCTAYLNGEKITLTAENYLRNTVLHKGTIKNYQFSAVVDETTYGTPENPHVYITVVTGKKNVEIIRSEGQISPTKHNDFKKLDYSYRVAAVIGKAVLAVGCFRPETIYKWE